MAILSQLRFVRATVGRVNRHEQSAPTIAVLERIDDRGDGFGEGCPGEPSLQVLLEGVRFADVPGDRLERLLRVRFARASVLVGRRHQRSPCPNGAAETFITSGSVLQQQGTP
jgi:hypothetical protein